MINTPFKALIISILFVPTTYAANDANAYYNAYNICSPSAHSLVRQECNYGRVAEKFYINCMDSKGFGEEDEISSPDYYAKYLHSHRQCTNISDRQTQNFCNYAGEYKQKYTACMEKYGFNANGEKITPQQQQDEDLSFF